MDFYIIKDGIENVVDEMQFANIYKPAGWKKDPKFYKPTEQDKTIKELKTETKIRNYTKAKKVKQEVFNDNIIKKG